MLARSIWNLVDEMREARQMGAQIAHQAQAAQQAAHNVVQAMPSQKTVLLTGAAGIALAGLVIAYVRYQSAEIKYAEESKRIDTTESRHQQKRLELFAASALTAVTQYAYEGKEGDAVQKAMLAFNTNTQAVRNVVSGLFPQEQSTMYCAQCKKTFEAKYAPIGPNNAIRIVHDCEPAPRPSWWMFWRRAAPPFEGKRDFNEQFRLLAYLDKQAFTTMVRSDGKVEVYLPLDDRLKGFEYRRSCSGMWGLVPTRLDECGQPAQPLLLGDKPLHVHLCGKCGVVDCYGYKSWSAWLWSKGPPRLSNTIPVGADSYKRLGLWTRLFTRVKSRCKDAYINLTPKQQTAAIAVGSAAAALGLALLARHAVSERKEEKKGILSKPDNKDHLEFSEADEIRRISHTLRARRELNKLRKKALEEQSMSEEDWDHLVFGALELLPKQEQILLGLIPGPEEQNDPPGSSPGKKFGRKHIMGRRNVKRRKRVTFNMSDPDESINGHEAGDATLGDWLAEMREAETEPRRQKILEAAEDYMNEGNFGIMRKVFLTLSNMSRQGDTNPLDEGWLDPSKSDKWSRHGGEVKAILRQRATQPRPLNLPSDEKEKEVRLAGKQATKARTHVGWDLPDTKEQATRVRVKLRCKFGGCNMCDDCDDKDRLDGSDDDEIDPLMADLDKESERIDKIEDRLNSTWIRRLKCWWQGEADKHAKVIKEESERDYRRLAADMGEIVRSLDHLKNAIAITNEALRTQETKIVGMKPIDLGPVQAPLTSVAAQIENSTKALMQATAKLAEVRERPEAPKTDRKLAPGAPPVPEKKEQSILDEAKARPPWGDKHIRCPHWHLKLSDDTKKGCRFGSDCKHLHAACPKGAQCTQTRCEKGHSVNQLKKLWKWRAPDMVTKPVHEQSIRTAVEDGKFIPRPPSPQGALTTQERKGDIQIRPLEVRQASYPIARLVVESLSGFIVEESIQGADVPWMVKNLSATRMMFIPVNGTVFEKQICVIAGQYVVAPYHGVRQAIGTPTIKLAAHPDHPDIAKLEPHPDSTHPSGGLQVKDEKGFLLDMCIWPKPANMSSIAMAIPEAGEQFLWLGSHADMKTIGQASFDIGTVQGFTQGEVHMMGQDGQLHKKASGLGMHTVKTEGGWSGGALVNRKGAWIGSHIGRDASSKTSYFLPLTQHLIALLNTPIPQTTQTKNASAGGQDSSQAAIKA